VTEIADLERSYRRWLRWYPRSFRDEHEEEMLGVLMVGARADQCRPGPMECVDLVASALCVRLRPRVPRSERSTFAMVRLMYLGAVVELAVGLTIVASLADVKASIVARDTGYTGAQWHAEVVGAFEPLVVVAGLAVGFWLWMAWANGRGLRWARVLFALFFGTTAVCMGHERSGRGGQRPPRLSLATAMMASAERKPKLRRMMRRIFWLMLSARALEIR